MAKFLHCNEGKSLKNIKDQVHDLNKLVHFCRWIIDAYVSDFYTLRHWDTLPKSVQEYFDECQPKELTYLLKSDETGDPACQYRVVPLYLLALQCSVHALSLNRTAVDLKSEEVVDNICCALQKENEDYPTCNTSNTAKAKFLTTMARASQAPNYKNGQCMDMKHIFRKHVKPKKQHEIQMLGQTISLLSKSTKCSQVVDVGAGLGHLSRILSFQHGLQITTVEAADGHAPKASKFDREMEKDINKALLKRKVDTSADILDSNESLSLDAVPQKDSVKRRSSDADTDISCLPQHVVCLIQPDIAATQFVEILQSKTKPEETATENSPDFVLAGLHACGDLTPTLLRVFTECPTAVGLASVACCYMKMSATSEVYDGGKCFPSLHNYPMSNYLRALPHHDLSYEAREMACHFADAYRDRLEKSPPHLKIHSYRAALQHLIKQIKPDFVSGHTRFVTKKGAEGTFTQYAKDNLHKVNVDFSTVPQELLDDCEKMTTKWMRVVCFYTLRLSLAPAVETLMLLDRMLYLFEKDIPSVLVPIFDSNISPRNFALLAQKPQGDLKKM